MTDSGGSSGNRLLRLFLVSFSALALEILLIRWIGSEIRVFAYLKNLVLMACVLGMGVGCATPVKDDAAPKPNLVFPVLFAILAVIVSTATITDLSNCSLLVDKNFFDFNVSVDSEIRLLINVMCVCGIFCLVMAIFDAFGRLLGREFSGHPALTAYAVNLLGSLAGVLVLTLASYLLWGPAAWLLIGLVPLIPIYRGDAKRFAVFAVCSVFSVGIAYATTANSIWSPYYRIDTKPLDTYLKGNNIITVPYQLGTSLFINHHVRYQRAINLSPSFVEQHPELKESNELRAYNMPLVGDDHPRNVLALGVGMGNDVCGALRAGAQHVDAVEIDPVILSMGKKLHPEHPYDDPRVHVIINDARNYLATTDKKYDLIMFGLVDSITALSTMSSVRLDNYLYTEESLKSATEHLTPDGIASISFATQPDWLRARLFQLVKKVAGSEPLAFNSQMDAPNSILIIWGPGLKEAGPKLLAKHKDLLAAVPPLMEPIDTPTYDWPFLYHRFRDLPGLSIFILASVLAISGILIYSRFKLRPRAFVGNLQFFLLGAGFLLLETRGILASAILFGSTWIINSIIIALVLLMALIANIIVIKTKVISEKMAYVGLLVSLIVVYVFPLSSLSAYPLAVQFLGTALVLGIPFMCSGIVFARAFATAENPPVALGINILGAILGGCLEYLSVIVGISGLTIIAIVVYAASWAASRLRSS